MNTTRAEDAQGTPTQSHISPSILVHEDNRLRVGPHTRGTSQKTANAREELQGYLQNLRFTSVSILRSKVYGVQGYLSYKKTHPHRTLP